VNYLGKAMALTPEQKKSMWLATQRGIEAMQVAQWAARMRDLYHPITLSDGSYWRNGKWNPRVSPPESP
jgi:hypothetical protein